MNFEKCGFCQKRIPKTARMDAKYCSATCRMNALRIRKREKRLAERELAKAKEANASDPQARLAASKAGFLARVAGSRLAAQLPNVKEDPFLTAQAEVFACLAMIAYYEKQKTVLTDRLQKARANRDESLDTNSCVIKRDEPITIPREATVIGVAMLSGELEGDAQVFYGSKPGRGKSPRHIAHYSHGATSYDGDSDDED